MENRCKNAKVCDFRLLVYAIAKYNEHWEEISKPLCNKHITADDGGNMYDGYKDRISRHVRPCFPLIVRKTILVLYGKEAIDRSLTVFEEPEERLT